MKIFFDTEFTGLRQNTTLISIGLITESKSTFYAEFNDYDKNQVDAWLRKHVMSQLILQHEERQRVEYFEIGTETSVVGDSETITKHLNVWLRGFGDVEMWSDCLAYDWVLFCQLFGGAFSIPSNVNYIPFDICTLFKAKGIDPDISREDFALGEHFKTKSRKHNALWDAKVIKWCYEKLI
jgi:hypothetical protein